MPFEAVMKQARTLFADGALATNLFAQGLMPGEPPETWTIAHPDRITDLHRAYIEAGSDIILTNSFGGNRRRLGHFGLADQVAALNRGAGQLARAAARGANRPVLIAGSVGPTGDFYRSPARFDAEGVAALFGEQIEALAEGDVDLVWIETMSAPEEMRAAAAAANRVGLPFVLTASFDQAGRTDAGLDPAGFVALVGSLPVRPAAVGVNCGIGPEDGLAALRPMAAGLSGLPMVFKPNAGLPTTVAGISTWSASPGDLARHAVLAFEAGASILGGCCGTTPAHIAAMRQAIGRGHDS